MSVGDLNTRVRRPSVAGANTQVLFNKGGVEGASPNLTFDGTNLVISTVNVITALNSDSIYLNGVIAQPNTSNLNFNNSTSINAFVTANGTSNTNLSFNINTTMNLVSLNVSGNIANTGNLAVSQNTVTGNLTIVQNTVTGNVSVTTLANVASLNVSANIANVGNLLVTQNSFTGNLSVTTLANIATGNIVTANIGTGNFTGTVASIGSPLSNTVTREVTGLSCNLTANLVTNGNSAQTNTLSVTFNETGLYQVEGLLLLGSNNAANVANGGCNIAFGNTGTATIATVQYAVQGRANGVSIQSNLIRTTAQTAVLTAAQNFSGSISANCYLVLTGYIKISGAGTVNIALASANSANLSFNLMPNTYVVYTKIG